VPLQPQNLLTLSHILRSSLTDCIPIGLVAGHRTDKVAIVQDLLTSSRTCCRHVTKGIHKEMHFLITDIGSKDLLLGYLWLASFEPRFSWRHAVIDKRVLPVVISSVNLQVIQKQPVIATALTEEEKQHIVRTLESQSTIRGVSTELAIQARQNKVAAEVPKVL
jgi:hypothetical protein